MYEPNFCNDESIELLNKLIAAAPDAPVWYLTTDYAAMFADWMIHEVNGPVEEAAWSASWTTLPTSSSAERLTPPDSDLVELSTYLRKMQEAHTEAVGGPLDGICFHFAIRPTESSISLVF